MAGMRPEIGPWSKVTMPSLSSSATTRPSPSKLGRACPETTARCRFQQMVVKTSNRLKECRPDLFMVEATFVPYRLIAIVPHAAGNDVRAPLRTSQ